MTQHIVQTRNIHFLRSLKNPHGEVKEISRSIFGSSSSRGGVPTPPGASNSGSPAVTPATSYNFFNNMFKTIFSKVENPLSYLNKEASNQSKPVETKTQLIQKANSHRISRSEVTAKTKALVKKYFLAETPKSKLNRMKELSEHIISFPPTRIIAAQNYRLIADLLDKVEHSKDDNFREASRECLTLIGVHPPPKGRGVNILSIDGGGTRGMMGLEVLERIETLSGKKICDLFDIICGVSTGGIIATLLTVKQYTVKECRDIYIEMSKKLFTQGKFQGSLGLITKHSYYNTTLWANTLKEIVGDDLPMIKTSRKLHTPRLAIIASIVNFPTIQPYVFRNYEHPAGRDSYYRGSTEHQLWTAIQASAAAPLYFSEVKLDNLLLQDGGIYANNPTAIAFHETKLLWPDEDINCLISVGNGRTISCVEPTPTLSTSIQDKLLRIIDSATDTESVHMNINDMLSNKVYYRFNPYMTISYGLDEINQERLEQMIHDAKLYVRRNELKIEGAAQKLMKKPTKCQKIHRWVKNKIALNGHYKPV